MQEEEELGWIGGLVRPLCSTVLRVGGWGLANDSHPCSLSMSQGHMSAPDNQPAIQEAEWTMKNPFIFLECKRELDFKMAHTSPFCCGSVCGVFFFRMAEEEWGMGSGGKGVLCTVSKWIGSVVFSCVMPGWGLHAKGNRSAC